MAFNAAAADKKYEGIIVSLVAGEEPTLAQLKNHMLAFNAADNLWFVEDHTVDPVVITTVNTNINDILKSPPVIIGDVRPANATFSDVLMGNLQTQTIACTLATSNFIKFTGTVATATDGTLFSTGSTWITHATAGQCAFKILAATTATTGDYATMRLRARSDAAVANTWGSQGTVGLNSSASANIAQYGNLIGIQGLAQPNAFTQTNSNNVICGVYSCMDKTATSSGHAWSMWIDDHSTTAKAADHYMVKITQNALGGTPVDIDGCFSIQPDRLPQIFTFDSVAGFISTSGSGTFSKTHKLAVKIAGDSTQYYIQMGTII
jgi:hypothetical protein